MYGDSMQAVVPGYLEASMDSFRRNQEQFKSAVEGAFANTPFADMAKRNLAMFEAATQGSRPPRLRRHPPRSDGHGREQGCRNGRAEGRTRGAEGQDREVGE